MKNIAVVGTGYVGTVVASCFAELGHQVTGLEVDASKLAQLREGSVPFFEAGLDKLLADGLDGGNLRFTDDPVEAVAGASAVFLCVGTPSGRDGRPDLRAAETAAAAVGGALRGPTVLVTKSTLPIGGARRLHNVTVAAGSARATPHRVAVVSNPEFLRQGSAVMDFLHPDRVVLGSDDASALDEVARLYEPIFSQQFPGGNGRRPKLMRTTLGTAEMIKYASNAFLATKVSFINELANICDGVDSDITEVAAAIGLDSRIGSRFLDAGVGWGGSCFGKDLRALISIAATVGYDAPLLRASLSVNFEQRARIVDKLENSLDGLSGRTVGVLGLAFKPGTDDLRDAPAVDIIERLVARGCAVVAHDPVVRSLPVPGVTVVDDPYAVARGADALVLLTQWPEYLALDLPALRASMRGSLFLDGRNFFDPQLVHSAGLIYGGIGRGRDDGRLAS